MSPNRNTLSPIIRQAWDSGNLRILTKTSPAQATGAHVSIIGHITKDELRRNMDDVEVFNGFANRFCWFCVKRARLLPEGGERPEALDLIQRVQGAVDFARTVGEMVRDEDAKALWAAIYEQVSQPLPGMLGEVTSRAEAQILRLSMVYALMDLQSTIGVPHLQAAKALWDYAEASARYVFGQSTGDSLADKVFAIISSGPVSRKQIHAKLHGHTKALDLDRALDRLERLKLARRQVVNTGGRPGEVWSIT